MASDLRLPQRDINIKWVDGVSVSTQPIPVEIKSADITLNVQEIAFGYVGIEDSLGNKLVINPDGSINVAGGSGPASNVSVTSSVLPTGAAADATVASGNTTLTGVHTDTTAIKNSLAGTIAVSGTFWQATQPVSGTFWQATQPVSGTFWQATQPVSLVSLPLPTGAAQDATVASTNVLLTTVAANQATEIMLQQQLQRLLDISRAVLATLQAINITLAQIGGHYVDPNEATNFTSSEIN